jgi:8-oxo-dGTP pyrophosphatase MutT (NUDIX family)
MHPLLAFARRTPLPRLIWGGRLLTLRVTRPFRFGVRTMVLDGDGGLLLVRHSYRPGWHLPGGGVKKWETMEQAAIRETAEEGGIAVQAMDRLFGVYANFGIGYCDHVALFVAGPWQAAPADSFEIVEARFFPLEALPADASPPTQRRVAELLGRAPRDGHW